MLFSSLVDFPFSSFFRYHLFCYWFTEAFSEVPKHGQFLPYTTIGLLCLVALVPGARVCVISPSVWVSHGHGRLRKSSNYWLKSGRALSGFYQLCICWINDLKWMASGRKVVASGDWGRAWPSRVANPCGFVLGSVLCMHTKKPVSKVHPLYHPPEWSPHASIIVIHPPKLYVKCCGENKT